MLAQERHNYILKMLPQKKIVRVSQLSHALKVSGETIRRDLEYLEKEGLLTRVYGGASMVKVDTNQGAFQLRTQMNVEAKAEIAQAALSYVSEGQSIVLDHSTTCLAFARALAPHFQDLTIVTNSMEILNVVAGKRSFNTVFCGGQFNHDELSCFGEQAMSVVRELNVDTAFIGVGGVSLREGCTETFFPGADMLRAMLAAAQRKIVLADSTKFDRATLIKVCEVTDVDLFITDSGIKSKVLEKYRNYDIEIINGLAARPPEAVGMPLN